MLEASARPLLEPWSQVSFKPQSLRGTALHVPSGQAASLGDEVTADWIIPFYFVLFIIYRVAYYSFALSL